MGSGITKAVVLTSLAILIVYDIAIYAAYGAGATISRVTLSWSQDIPIILVGVGVLIGHLFWPQPRPKKEKEES
jgi:hypothetical protein